MIGEVAPVDNEFGDFEIVCYGCRSTTNTDGVIAVKTGIRDEPVGEAEMSGFDNVGRELKIWTASIYFIEEVIESCLMIDGFSLLDGGAVLEDLTVENHCPDVLLGHSTAFGAVAVVGEGGGKIFQ